MAAADGQLPSQLSSQARHWRRWHKRQTAKKARRAARHVPDLASRKARYGGHAD
jgi:hypothetical protein